MSVCTVLLGKSGWSMCNMKYDVKLPDNGKGICGDNKPRENGALGKACI